MEPDPSPLPPPPSPTSTSPQITLEVGTRTFTTTRPTLSESAYFTSLLSGKWQPPPPDGKYFIDSDPDLFEHMLRYLRRGISPLFYDRNTGHDYNKYLAVLEEARYFMIPVLESWLEKEYEDVVTIKVEGLDTTELNDYSETLRGDADVTHEIHFGTRERDACPARIDSHMDGRRPCNAHCLIYRGRVPVEVHKAPYVRLVRISRHVQFDMTKCRKLEYLKKRKLEYLKKRKKRKKKKKKQDSD